MHIYFDVGTVRKKNVILQRPLEDDTDSHVCKQRMALSKPRMHHIIMANYVSVCLLSMITYLRKVTLLRRTKKTSFIVLHRNDQGCVKKGDEPCTK
jgi:hypothetical protein